LTGYGDRPKVVAAVSSSGAALLVFALIFVPAIIVLTPRSRDRLPLALVGGFVATCFRISDTPTYGLSFQGE
jgi:hypothetical protein